MALIKCYECGNEVSDNAVSCPNCGARIANNAKVSFKWEGIAFVLILLGVILAFVKSILLGAIIILVGMLTYSIGRLI